jgi:RNA polymerase-associated protein
MRVRIALVEKGLAWSEREIDLARKPPELFQLNPAGAVPVLVDGGAALPESAVILEYLDDRYPERPLLPPDPLGRARARLLQQRITAALGAPSLKAVRGSEEEKVAAAAAVRDALAALERDAPADGFLAGPFSIADIALAPFVARLPAHLRPAALGLERLGRWERAAMARPSIAEHTAPRRGARPDHSSR